MGVDELERRLESDIETCGAHEHVKLVKRPVFVDDTLGDNLADATIDWLDIGLYKSLEVAVARRDAAASRRPLGDDELLQLLVAGSHAAVHLVRDDLSECVAHLAALLVHAEEAVDLGFDALAEV